MGYSRWTLADLQIHTPADKNHRYGDVCGPGPNEAFARELLQAHLDAGIRIVAVTDHNSVAWWPILNKIGQELGVFVFPGIEININKCHLMAIWDRDEQGHKLAGQFLASCFKPGVEPLEPDRTSRPVEGSVLQVAERAARSKALVFAPHSTAKEIGLFGKNVCNTSSAVARSSVMSGFDVIGDTGRDVLKNPAGEFGKRVPPWFSSGDVRDLADVGKRACYLKTSESPTLESIRQAFLMPETRVRLRGEMHPKWKHVKDARFLEGPEPTCARIESITIDGGFHDRLEVEFGPGLNAIIGGKGTGKSTLIEILRFALEGPPSIAPKPFRKDGRDSLTTNFPSNADASIAFATAEGESYEVQRAGGNSAGSSLYSEGKKLDIDPRRRVGVKVFGQRELAAFPGAPDALKEFVLVRREKAYDDACAGVDKALAAARKIAEQLDELDHELTDFREAKEELEDLNEKLGKIVKAGSSDLAGESEALQQADDALGELFGWPEEVIEQAEALAKLEPPELPNHPKLPSGIKSTRRDGKRTIAKAAQAAIDAARELERKFDEHEASWERSRDKRREEIARLLADAGLDDPAELGELQARKVVLERQLRDSGTKQKERAKLLPKREAAIEALESARRARSRLVDEAVAELNELTGQRVRVKLDPLSERAPLLEFFAEEINNRGLTPNQSTRLEKHSGRDLANAVFSKEEDALDKLGLTSGLVEKLEDAEGPVLRRLEEIESPDQIRIEVNLAESGTARWTDVEDASPGQAATAMLELALISSDEPLIIDQPEDDLDNRFIYDEVVMKIAEVATHRQVIVATHNANIPILGDAELILALDASTNRGKVLACGGLDESKVANTARKILEGGEQAFEARAKRYAEGSVD